MSNNIITWKFHIKLHAGGQDFYPYSTRHLSFYSGVGIGSLRCVSISIYDDARVENDVEYFYFSVSNGSRAIVSQTERRIRINIHDNDGKRSKLLIIIL